MKTVSERLKHAREWKGWTQAQLAVAADVSTGTVGNIEAGLRQSKGSIPQIADALGVSYQWLANDKGEMLSPAKLLESEFSKQIHPLAQANQAQSAIESDSLKPILVWEHPDELPEGEYVFVPRLNIQLSTGHGREQIDVDLIKDKPQAFRADWIRELRLKPAGLASMRVTGDSMEPRLYSGDAVVVDTADTEVLDGKAYALWYDGGERIKRLFRLPGGGVRIVSDNRDKYPSIDLSADQCQHVRIIGRVRHVASTRGL